MRQIKRIFIHCTAGSQKMTKEQLLAVFKQRGWKNPGYHYAIFPDGKVERLLDESQISNGVQGYNSTSINIAYIGGIDNKGCPCDNRTDAQKSALENLLVSLKQSYPDAHIMGHRDIWGKDSSKWKKACPCFNAEEEYKNITATKIDPNYKPSVPNSPLKPKSIMDKIKELAPWIRKN